MSDFEVTIQSTTVVYVKDAADHAQAIEFAKELATGDTYDAKLLTTDDERDRARRHADKVSKP